MRSGYRCRHRRDADAIKRGVASLTNNVARNNANSIGSRSGVC